MSVLAFQWPTTDEALILAGIIAAIFAGLERVVRAMNKTAAAVNAGNVEAAASNAIKVAGIQETLRATPGASPITPESLHAAPMMQDPAVQQAAIKLLQGTGDGGLPPEDKLREIIREELASINTPRANPDRILPQ